MTRSFGFAFWATFARSVLKDVVAAFADVVAGTFNGFAADKAGEVTKVVANGAVATTSMLFIIEAVALGFFLKYSKFNKWINTLVQSHYL